MDKIFRALDDPCRRALLDSLYDLDGQTLKELCGVLPTMTRQGVMNHLGILAAANLVASRRSGREKIHYLNRVPIQQVHDRWMDKFTQPVAGMLSALTDHLESGHPDARNHKGDDPMTSPTSTPTYIYETYIRCDPSAAWEAIVDGDKTCQYFYGTSVDSTWFPGDPLKYSMPDGSLAAEGKVVVFDPPNRLEITFLALWDPDLAALGPVRQAWKVEAVGGATKVSVEYFDIAVDDPRMVDFAAGIPLIVAGMKTLLETGSPMTGVPAL